VSEIVRRTADPPARPAGTSPARRESAPPPPAVRCTLPLHSLYRFSQLSPEVRQQFPQEGELDSWIEPPEAVRSASGELALRATGWRLSPHSLVRFTLRRPAVALADGKVAARRDSPWLVTDQEVTWLVPVARRDVGVVEGGGGGNGGGHTAPETISQALAFAPESVRELFADRRPEWTDAHGITIDGKWSWSRVALWHDRAAWVRATAAGWTAGGWLVTTAPRHGELVRRG